ncbi:MAG: hypothetical protein AAB611_02050, partial [Patescibacteria group bacterium]
FKNPEDFTLFIKKYLDENIADYERAFTNELAQSIGVRAHAERSMSKKEKEHYLRTVTTLLRNDLLPENTPNPTSLAAETFYTALAKKLDTMRVPLEYYYLHYELVRTAKIRALAYDAISNIDADPIKSALMIKILTKTQSQLERSTKALSQKLALE